MKFKVAGITSANIYKESK